MAAPLLLGLCGIGFIGSAIFHPDPGDGFPPGTPTGIRTAISPHGVLHMVCGSISGSDRGVLRAGAAFRQGRLAPCGSWCAGGRCHLRYWPRRIAGGWSSWVASPVRWRIGGPGRDRAGGCAPPIGTSAARHLTVIHRVALPFFGLACQGLTGGGALAQLSLGNPDAAVLHGPPRLESDGSSCDRAPDVSPPRTPIHRHRSTTEQCTIPPRIKPALI
jgi:hypothetical protein